MKILVDHNLDRRLKRHFPDHEVSTVQENGWANERNGELISLAEQNGFAVLLTADANIKNQQNISGRQIAVLILRAQSNRLATHVEMLERVEQALSTIRAGQIVEVVRQS